MFSIWPQQGGINSKGKLIQGIELIFKLEKLQNKTKTGGNIRMPALAIDTLPELVSGVLGIIKRLRKRGLSDYFVGSRI